MNLNVASFNDEKELAKDTFVLEKADVSLLPFALPLLSTVGRIKNILPKYSVNVIKNKLCKDIEDFEKHAKNANVPPKKISMVKYIVCATFDDLILQSKWGEENAWCNDTLLSTLFNDTRGGEYFFVILDEAMKEKVFNFDALEIIYYCLALGFCGKYRIITDGEVKLLRLRQELWNLLRVEKVIPSLYLNSVPVEKEKTNRLYHFFKSMFPFVALLTVLIIIYIPLKVHLHEQSSQILSEVEKKVLIGERK